MFVMFVKETVEISVRTCRWYLHSFDDYHQNSRAI